MFPKRISQISSFSHVLGGYFFFKKLILTYQNYKKKLEKY